MKLAIVGYGRMGKEIERAARERGHEITAVLDAADTAGDGLTEERLAGAEVATEFTTGEAALPSIEALARCGVDAVVGTTGWYTELERATRAVEAAGTGLIYAPNFSLGTQMLFRLAELAARLANRLEGYDVYVQEAHHRHKRDHPSGTAAKLADLLVERSSAKRAWRLGTGEGVIDPETLQVTAVRAGEITGIHLVGMDGPDDRLEIRHEAKSRAGFARGAVVAAEWILGRTGVHTLEDMLAELWS